MNKLLVIAVFSASLIIYQATTYACSCKGMDIETLFKNADAVFLAEVTDTKLKKLKLSENRDELDDVIEAKFTVIEHFKKTSYKVDVVHDLSFGFGNCSIGLISGMEYIFFVLKGEGEFNNYVGMCTGSVSVNIHARDFDKALDKYRNLGKIK